MKTVFVDSSGFYAALDRTDPFHPAAKDAIERAARERWRLVTTNSTVQETWALVQRRLGWDAIDDWLGRVLPLCEIIWVDKVLHEAGALRCRQARERRLSLTDCVSIEWMKQNGVSEAIAQDEHFDREGISQP